MTSSILRTTSRLLVVLFVLFAMFLLWRGHNDPGGGFAAGLVAAGAFSLNAVAFGPESARSTMPVDPALLMPLGLLLALSAGVAGLVAGDGFLAGQWLTAKVGGEDVKLGTPLLFDVGVFLTVVGSVMTVIITLAAEED